MVARFVKFAAEAALNGYAVTPLRGKAPMLEEWQKAAANRPSYEDVMAWPDDPDLRGQTGVGFVLGSPAGDGNFVVAVDIDLEDYDEVQDVRGSLPTTPMAKKGAKGVTLFYRAPKELASIRRYNNELKQRLVDFLGAGSQTVMPPSMHPETGAEYVWAYNTKLVAPMDLPLLSEDHIEEMEEMLAAIGWNRRLANSNGQGISLATMDGRNVADPNKQVNRLALDNIPDWIEELPLYNGMWKGVRYACVNTLRASSSGRDTRKRKRNLSIHPHGIQDFGTGVTYSPIDLVVAFLGISADDAFVWLSKRVNPLWPKDDEEFVVPYKKPEKGEPLDEGERLKIKVNRNAVGPLPIEAYETAPGFIKTLADEQLRMSPNMPKTLAVMSAISAMSALTARRYVGTTKGALPLNMYCIAMSQTGGGKDMAIQFGSKLLSACSDLDDERSRIAYYGSAQERFEDKLNGSCRLPDDEYTDCFKLMRSGGSDYTGDAAVISDAWATGTFWMRVDEFGSVFGNWSKAKGDATPIATILRSQYNLREWHVPKKYSAATTLSAHKVTRSIKNEAIYWPQPVILGVTTPDQMYDALDEAMAENGTINRFIIAHEDAPELTFEEYCASMNAADGEYKISPEVAREAAEIVLFGHRSGTDTFGVYYSTLDNQFDCFKEPERIYVGFADDAAMKTIYRYGFEVMRKSQEIVKEGVEERYKSFVYSRLGENALRLACLAAIADNPDRDSGVLPEVGKRHVDWALIVMRQVEENLVALVMEGVMSKEAKVQSEIEKKLLAKAQVWMDEGKSGLVEEGVWLHRSKLQQSFARGGKKAARLAIEEMVKAGEVDLFKKGRIEYVKFVNLCKD